MPLSEVVPLRIDGTVYFNHHWRPDDHGVVYCYRYDRDVVLRKWARHCFECPYFMGTIQGEGVECAYPKGAPQVTPEKSVTKPAPSQFEGLPRVLDSENESLPQTAFGLPIRGKNRSASKKKE